MKRATTLFAADGENRAVRRHRHDGVNERTLPSSPPTMAAPMTKTVHFSSLLLASLLVLGGCAGSPSKAMKESPQAITACSGAPHCVSSQSALGSARYIEPLRYKVSADAAAAALLKVLNGQDNATIKSDAMPKIHATFKTAIGFVDDVTFVVQEASQTIDVKSTSRLGFYDFGVNRRRVEALRTQFNAAMAQGGQPDR